MINSRTLSEVLNAGLNGNPDAAISDITHDSRHAGPGTVFVAIRGATLDAHRFIEDVMRRGAVGIISELDAPADFRGVWLKVENARIAMARAASVIYGEPSKKLSLVGVTGTNGKTTTTYLCNAIAEAAGLKTAMLTTVEYRVNGISQPAVRTTPEATDTNKFLFEAVKQGCKFAAMEASSQAIDLHRCDFLQFRVAIFTNLTQDHLDYHGTMENYFLAKKRLFDGSIGTKPQAAVINIDDEWGRLLADDLRKNNVQVVTTAQDREADFTAVNPEVSISKGTAFTIKWKGGEAMISSPLIGKPHIYNILSAAAATQFCGIDFDSVIRAVAQCKGAPGRFEPVATNRDFAVFVDYAHTDDALANTLQTARKLAKGRIITVFGCGGDRDRGKRAPMGKAAGLGSDFVIITSDNPRTEDPLKIISEIEAGIKQTNTQYKVISDRRNAIYEAIRIAKSGDIVIIAGKGHETYQIIGDQKFHFDDREIAAEALRNISD